MTSEDCGVVAGYDGVKIIDFGGIHRFQLVKGVGWVDRFAEPKSRTGDDLGVQNIKKGEDGRKRGDMKDDDVKREDDMTRGKGVIEEDGVNEENDVRPEDGMGTGEHVEKEEGEQEPRGVVTSPASVPTDGRAIKQEAKEESDGPLEESEEATGESSSGEEMDWIATPQRETEVVVKKEDKDG
jgi:hypothetical protein